MKTLSYHNTGIDKETEFVFSDYDGSGEDETFEDSLDTLTDSEKANTDLFTPVNLKSAFARTLQAKSTFSPNPSSSSTPKPGTATKSSARSKSSDPAAKQSAMKRIASSPADAKDQKKKSRAQSMIPTKK